MTLEGGQCFKSPNKKSKLIIFCWAGGGVVGRRLLHGGKSGQRVCCKVGVGGSGPRPAYFIRPDRISLEAGHPANITYKLQVYPGPTPCNLSSMAFGSWNSYPGFQHGLKNSNSLSMIPSYPRSFRFILLNLFRLV